MKYFSRISILVLCCAILVFIGCKPITASANTATIDIGIAMNDVIAVDPMLVPFALTLIAAGYVFNNTDELIDAAQDLSDRMKPTTIEWAKKFANSLESGAQAVAKLTTSVIDDLNQGMSALWEDVKAIPKELSYLVAPQTLTNLGTLSLTDILVQDVAGILTETQTITQRMSTLLSNIKAGILAIPQSFVTAIDSLGTTFKAEFDQFKTWFVNINNNLKEEVHQIPNWLSSINTNMKSELGQIKTWFSNVNTTIKNEILGIKTTLGQIKDTAIGKVTTAVENVGLKIDSLIGTITAALTPNNGSGGEDNKNANDTINSGINGMIPFFGSGKDYLAEYSTGFLAAGLLFNSFADIPFINQLLFISVTIGLIGTLLGIALNVAQSDSTARSSNKSKAGGN